MRTITKILFVLLFVSVLLIPISVHATSYSSDNAIAWLQEQEGRSIDYDGYYGAQCVDLIMAYYKYLIGYNVGGNGDDYATNTLPSGWTRTKNGQPQKGDILVYAGGTGAGHIAIYESDNVTWHQNYGGQYVRRVTNKHYTSFVAFDGATYWGCIHPNFNDYVHIKDDSYDTNFKAFPYAKITNDNLFDAGHNKMNANNWIAATDECTILEVYTDGCCKVTYPLDSGGTRTLYSKISLFNIVYDCDHSYTYKFNSSSHWKECRLCGDKQSASSHNFTNSCDPSCSTCEYTRTITHTYDSTYSYDSVDHWKHCTVCGNYGTFEDHSYTNNCDTNCNICGYTRTTEHSYDNDCDATCNVCGDTRNTEHNYDAYDYDFDHHWKVCSVCGDADEATEAHSISSVYYLKDIFYVTYHFTDCTVCGGELGYRHKYTNDCDASCNDCEYTRNTKHSYDHDCDTDCNICGETRSTQHIYDNENDTTCNICGEVRTVETLPSSTPEDTEPITEPNTTPDTNNTPSSSNKNDNNDDEDNNNTTIIIVAVAGAVTVSTVSILGTAFIMKKKR